MNQFWKFSIKHGWEQIEDFLNDDFDVGLVNCGYARDINYLNIVASLGGEHYAFNTNVYGKISGAKNEPPYPFLVDIELNNCFALVAVDSLPDLIELLSKIAPIAEACIAASDRHEAEMEILRKNY